MNYFLSRQFMSKNKFYVSIYVLNFSVFVFHKVIFCLINLIDLDGVAFEIAFARAYNGGVWRASSPA